VSAAVCGVLLAPVRQAQKMKSLLPYALRYRLTDRPC
jgi:hypothetical protein